MACKLVYQKSQFGNFFEVLGMEKFGIFKSHLVFLRPLSVFYSHAVYFVVTGYIFFQFWYVAERQIWQPCDRSKKNDLDVRRLGQKVAKVCFPGNGSDSSIMSRGKSASRKTMRWKVLFQCQLGPMTNLLNMYNRSSSMLKLGMGRAQARTRISGFGPNFI
jgi:hypothetical protein